MLEHDSKIPFRKPGKILTLTCLICCLLISINQSFLAQVLYVDAARGSDKAEGTSGTPVASLNRAVELAKEIAGNKQVTIKITPGLYLLTKQIKIESKNDADTALYTIEALYMPDDSSWQPASMPVIQSVSANNVKTYFDHCAGFEILRNNVRIRGLKFVGNANPAVLYYYPIERDSAGLKNIQVSQCMFIAEKNSAPIQGAVYMEGGNSVHVNHCIFYQCKNAVLVFFAAKDFSLTNSIIYGAYESAIYYGYKNDLDSPFIFRGNIITNCNYFWLGSKNEDHPLFVFNNSLIANNTHFMGIYDGEGGPKPYKVKGTHVEKNIQKSGEVILTEAEIERVPKNYLHPSAKSAGSNIKAGIFIDSLSADFNR